MARHQSVYALLVLYVALYVKSLDAMPANPHPMTVTLYDGSNVTVRLVGDEFGSVHVLEDNGHVILPVDPPDAAKGIDYEYATLEGGPGGKYVGTGKRIGDIPMDSLKPIDPRTVRPVQDPEKLLKMRTKSPQGLKNNRGRRLSITASGQVPNLVCLIRFQDHSGRTLPSKQQITNLMNQEGGGDDCPTGSVRDIYLENSYGTFDLTSVVTDWYDCSLTEAQAAGSDSATGDDSRLDECLYECLEQAAVDFDFADFDSNNDGEIDAIAFLHSGFGAETGSTDCHGTSSANRIWSHKFSFEYFTQGVYSSNGVSVPEYHISPAVWGTCGSEIGRIGVIAHETGHFLGLPDLYDYTTGSGIGSWGMMANSWGTDGTQLYPPAFSAWSRYILGWLRDGVEVQTLSQTSDSGTYSLLAIGGTDTQRGDLLKITFGFSSADEYLLVCNRRPYGIDSKAPGDGILVWHIDESNSCGGNSCPGYAGQACYPFNGEHYQVALTQADGEYDLEQGYYSDTGDVFIGSGASLSDCGPSTDCEPNTRAYHNGELTLTGISITDISDAADTVSLTVALDATNSGDVRHHSLKLNGCFPSFVSPPL